MDKSMTVIDENGMFLVIFSENPAYLIRVTVRRTTWIGISDLNVVVYLDDKTYLSASGGNDKKALLKTLSVQCLKMQSL